MFRSGSGLSNYAYRATSLIVDESSAGFGAGLLHMQALQIAASADTIFRILQILRTISSVWLNLQRNFNNKLFSPTVLCR